MNQKQQELLKAAVNASRLLRLDQPMRSGRLPDIIAPPNQSELSGYDFSAAELQGMIEQAFDCLDDREQHILRAHFGIGKDPTHLRALSEELELSRERVRQIEARALQKLKVRLERLMHTPNDQDPARATTTELDIIPDAKAFLSECSDYERLLLLHYFGLCGFKKLRGAKLVAHIGRPPDNVYKTIKAALQRLGNRLR